VPLNHSGRYAGVAEEFGRMGIPAFATLGTFIRGVRLTVAGTCCIAVSMLLRGTAGVRQRRRICGPGSGV
jgi:hypothetical protein